MTDRLAATLAALLDSSDGARGGSRVVTDPAVLAGRTSDWTGRWRGGCRLAVSPSTGAEVGAVLAACAGEHVVVQGGNTGLVGGAVPEPGDVLLLTDRLTAMSPPNEAAHTVVVEAGATLAAVQQHLRPYGLELPIDLASRQSATVGGMAATNAGGVRVLHDGPMRSQVIGVDAYDVSGQQIAVLHDLVKDNTGYALGSLLVGSEGTLGVITRLLLRATPRVQPAGVFLLGVPDLTTLLALTGRLRRDLRNVLAMEMVSAAALAEVARQRAISVPVPSTWALLVEVADGGRPDAFLHAGAVVAEALAECDLGEAPVLAAEDAAGMRNLWSWREQVTESVAAAAAGSGQIVTKLDLTLPAQDWAAFEVDLTGLLAGRSARAFLFGHVADGNVHVNLVGPPDPVLEDAVLRRAAAGGGSISAEHGIGRAKAPWFELARTPTERRAMRAVKDALDPESRLGRAIW